MNHRLWGPGLKESTARDIQVYGLIILIGINVVLAIPTIESLTKGAPPSLDSLVIEVVILSVAFLLGLVTFPARKVAGFLTERRRTANPPVPSDLSREAFALAESSILVWSSGSMLIDSFQINGSNVLNFLARRRNEQGFSQKVLFLEQAYGYYYGWKNMRSLEDGLVEEIGGLLELGDQIDEAPFFILLRHLHRLVTAGVSVANSFSQSVRNVGIENLPDHQIRDWRQFSGKANRLIDDLMKLGQKANKLFHLEENYFIQQVQEL